MSETLNPQLIPLGLYVHFPWCVKKCPYCDFNSHPAPAEAGDALFTSYLNALLIDLDSQRRAGDGRAFSTVFFGGGTPSLLPPAGFRTLLEHLQKHLEPDAEITMEANPGTLEHHDLGAYREAGINRLSLGAQSFAGVQLERLGRIHGPADIVSSFEKARSAGFENINLDIMYGLPEQSPDEARADLATAIALEPEHLSWYQLTIEPKTEFARRPPVLATDSNVEAMEAVGWALLAKAGYERYEVSAYAKPGFHCRHNLNYWMFGDYLGVGAGAHGKVSTAAAIVRTAKPRQPRLYLNDALGTDRQVVPSEALTGEFLLNALRLRDGVGWDLFTERTGLSSDLLGSEWQALADLGLVHPERLQASELGFRHLDTLISRFL